MFAYYMRVGGFPFMTMFCENAAARTDCLSAIVDTNICKDALAPIEAIRDSHHKTLLALDPDPPPNYNGIKQIHAIDFLLDSAQEMRPFRGGPPPRRGNAPSARWDSTGRNIHESRARRRGRR